MNNMFSMDGWENVTYCKDCKFSYTPIIIKNDKTITGSRFCERTSCIVKDNGYCSEGIRKDV